VAKDFDLRGELFARAEENRAFLVDMPFRV
jgi:hypothetical protein